MHHSLTASLLSVILIGSASASDGCPCCEDGQKRTGNPQAVSHLARPSNSKHYLGYYVGGGAAVGGDYPCADEGTYGWDYQLFPKLPKVALKWWHGRKYQGGTGAYKTDGPVVPDLPRIIDVSVQNVKAGKGPHGDK